MRFASEKTGRRQVARPGVDGSYLDLEMLNISIPGRVCDLARVDLGASNSANVGSAGYTVSSDLAAQMPQKAIGRGRSKMLKRMCRFIVYAGLFVATISSAVAAEVELSKGQLKRSGDLTTQAIAVKNNTTATRTVSVECGFFHGNTLLAASDRLAQNVESGQTAYIEVLGYTGEADRTDCRVKSLW